MNADTLCAEVRGALFSLTDPNDETMVRAALLAMGVPPESTDDFDAAIIGSDYVLLLEVDDDVLGARALPINSTGARRAFAIYCLLHDAEAIQQQGERLRETVQQARITGLSLRRIGELLGMSHEAVRQLSS